MVHRKSRTHYEEHLSYLSAWEKRWFEKMAEKDALGYIIREVSVKCENGDKVWHPETEPEVRKELLANSEDGSIPNYLTHHDYGEVLNKFGV